MKVESQYDVYVGEYPFHKQLYDELVPLLENYPDKQGMETNVKATMTEWNWDPLSDRLNRFINCIIQESLSGYLKWWRDSPCFRKDFSPSFLNFWGNVYRKGNYTKEHDHLYHHLSMVYFLKSKWYYSPLVFTHSGKKVQPKEGRYVLFPSHIKHHVPKHRFKETRITLSGNIS